jgi:23S rRNA maturation mini-RNase III
MNHDIDELVERCWKGESPKDKKTAAKKKATKVRESAPDVTTKNLAENIEKYHRRTKDARRAAMATVNTYVESSIGMSLPHVVGVYDLTETINKVQACIEEGRYEDADKFAAFKGDILESAAREKVSLKPVFESRKKA